MIRGLLPLRTASALLVLSIVATPAAVTAGRQADHKTYSNSTYGYSISYPGNWKRSSIANVQFIALSPDKNAFITANAVKGTLSLSDIKAAQKNAMNGLGKVQTNVTYALKSIHGLTFQSAEALVKASTGKVLDVILLDTDQHATLYDFNAGVVNGTTATSKEITALQNALKSITIKP